MRETLEERAARLAAAHVNAGELQRRRLAALPCSIPGCRNPGLLTPAGRRCQAEHLAPQPTTGYCAPGRCYCPATPCARTEAATDART